MSGLKEESVRALDIINQAQESLWNLHHQIKLKDEKLGTDVWMWTLQIEQALKVINANEFGRDQYWADNE